MTTFGKILTVLAFLLSLAQGALSVFVYTSRVNYSVVVNKYKVIADEATASEKAWKDKADKLQKDNDVQALALNKIANVKPEDAVGPQVTKIGTETGVKDQQVKTLNNRVDELEKKLLVEQKKNSEYNAIVKAHELESLQNLKDKNEYKTQLTKERADNVELQAKANKAREDKVRFEIKAIALEETNKQLESRGQDLAKELTLAKKALLTGTAGSGGVTTISLSAPNPPTFAVDGKIMAVGDGLVEISVGSDAGLLKGHTLDAFRLSPKSQYLGMIRLITVEPTRSVGQVVGKPAAPLQRGDNVASKILNGN